MRIFGIVSYKGSHYQGWQKQEHKNTIQDEIEKVLSQILNQEIHIFGSGRTDTGVHAIGQTFHFDIDKLNVDISRLRYSLNCLLPEDIHIISLNECDKDFHARYSLKSKVYCYQLYLGENDPFLNETYWIIPYFIDIDLLRESLNKFIGRHNFKNFTSKEEDEDNFVRNIFNIEIKQDNNKVFITFVGDGFMRYMIRNIIGTCIAISSKKEPLSLIDYLLDSNKARTIVSYKAPGNGLLLVKVNY